MSVDWNALLAGLSVSVAYSDSDFGCEPPLGDTDLVLLKLPGGSLVEARWDDSGSCYVVTLYRADFDTIVDTRTFVNADDAIYGVAGFVAQAHRAGDEVAFSASDANTCRDAV